MAKYESRLDLYFSALGNPTRRAILSRLARGRATVSELIAVQPMALPSLMEHLKKLEDAGLIISTKAGRVRVCELAPDAFSPAQDWLSAQKTIWNTRLDRLDDYVATILKERDDEP